MALISHFLLILPKSMSQLLTNSTDSVYCSVRLVGLQFLSLRRFFEK